MPILNRTFCELRDDECETLLKHSTKHTFSSGEIIIEQGTILNDLYVICFGNARVVQQSFDEANVEFTGPLGPGDMFGEMSFMDGNQASATLIADGNTEVLKFGRDDIYDLVSANAGLGMRFYQSLLLIMCKRLRATNIRVNPI